MAIAHNLGFPRIGRERELKQALESAWRGDTDGTQLQATATRLRQQHWQLQRAAGIALIPARDFALYDHIVYMSLLLGAVTWRFYFGCSGSQGATGFVISP